MADITIVNGVYKPTYNWGDYSCNYTLWLFNVATEKSPFLIGKSAKKHL